MRSAEIFTHYPTRLLWVGGCILAACAILSCGFLFPIARQPVFPLPPRTASNGAVLQAIPSFHLTDGRAMRWEVPGIEESLRIAINPPRPDAEKVISVAQVSLREAGESQGVALPGRIDLRFDENGILHFARSESLFWIELEWQDAETLLCRERAVMNGENQERVFALHVQEPPIRTAEELAAELSPFQVLSGAQWLGTDLISQLALSGKPLRLQIEDACLDVGEGEWLCWKDRVWKKAKSLQEGQHLPIARIRALHPHKLEFDGWNEQGSYVRIEIPLQQIAMPRIKNDDLFSSLRIRSEKQISCMLEKQSLILRVGAWALKDGSRWKVLRSADERQQVLDERKTGELFILDQIDPKLRTIKGRLFLPNRIQVIPVELTEARSQRKRKAVRIPHASTESPQRNIHSGRNE